MAHLERTEGEIVEEKCTNQQMLTKWHKLFSFLLHHFSTLLLVVISFALLLSLSGEICSKKKKFFVCQFEMLVFCVHVCECSQAYRKKKWQKMLLISLFFLSPLLIHLCKSSSRIQVFIISLSPLFLDIGVGMSLKED